MELTTLGSIAVFILIGLPLISACLSGTARAWLIAETLSAATVLIALLSWVGLVFFNLAFNLSDWLLLTPLRATLLLLVSFIAYIVLRYSRTNFTSDPDSSRFLTWLTLTICAVSLTVISNHLILFWLAWTAISLSLHKLLIFYPTRYRAVLATHKKFIFARIAELCLAAAFVLLYLHHQSFFITDILQHYPVAHIAWEQQTAAILLAIVALIKCAQLPVHGWLIQVVESPTPVSALLHAGVINLGGFLMLLFAPLFSQVASAQWLVLIVAGFTAAFAALVMMTRISIKVRLAWSTSAQMGLMLIECALGVYELALLHLIAHSCYKANAFLTAGNAVSDDIQHQYTGNTKPSLPAWLAAGTLAIAIVTAVNIAFGFTAPYSPWVLITIAIAVSLAIRFTQAIRFALLLAVIDALVLITLYILLKLSTGFLFPAIEQTYVWQADAFISALFIGVLSLYLFMEYKPLNNVSQRLFIALNAGCYLDEWSTRLTLYLWPIGLPKTNFLVLR